jgi:WD repeat-containing protein 55
MGIITSNWTKINKDIETNLVFPIFPRKNFRSPNNDMNSMSDDDSDLELIYESDDPPVLLINDEAQLNGIELEEFQDESRPDDLQLDDDTDYSITSDSDGSEMSDAGEGTSGAAVPNGYEVDEDGSVRRVIEDYNEEEEDDEVIKAIISEIKKPRSKPPDIKTDDYVVDLSFHPQLDMLAVGTVAGDVVIYSYANEENTVKQSLEVHTKAVRCLEYSHDGKIILSTSRDKTIMITDCETGKLKRFWDDAHDEPVYSMHVLNENLFATGDDDGTLKLWDIRQRDSNAIFSLKEVDDHISSILTNDANKYLLFTSGDGYLTTINIPGK